MSNQEPILSSTFIDFDLFPKLEYATLLKSIKGRNQKNIFIVFYIKKGDETKAALLELLQKILKAIKLDFEQDIAYLLVEETTFSTSFNYLLKSLDFNKLMIFGIPPKQFGINLNLPLNEPVKLKNCDIIISSNLKDIAANKQLKGRLWQGLQKMFL